MKKKPASDISTMAGLSAASINPFLWDRHAHQLTYVFDFYQVIVCSGVLVKYYILNFMI